MSHNGLSFCPRIGTTRRRPWAAARRLPGRALGLAALLGLALPACAGDQSGAERPLDLFAPAPELGSGAGDQAIGGDLGVGDQGSAADLTPGGDQSSAPDLAPKPPDLAMALPDLAVPPDLAAPPRDLAAPLPDLAQPPDLAPRADLTMARPESPVISEIMYHPVEENGPVDNHEFLEIHNRSDVVWDISGWRLTGDVQLTFPAGTKLAPRSYTVVARNRAALAAVQGYQLRQGDLLGDYTGQLDNGGGTVRLVDGGGAVIDLVTWRPIFPWPIGADALGADDEWLSALSVPLTKAPHQYRGRSLERVAFDVVGSEVSNWAPSPLDGATPGRANSVTGKPPAIVLTRAAKGPGPDPLIRAGEKVTIYVTFSALGPLMKPQLQYFVDDVQAKGEAVTTVPLVLNNGIYEAALPGQPDNSIVRYRILGDRGGGSEVISPRPSDPMEWWAYFVTPQVATRAAVYHLFIHSADWTKMYDNVNFGTDDRRVAPGGSPANRCQIRATWDAEVPAVFIVDGVVYDTFVRYQGSRWNRTNGIALDVAKTTISPLPARPNPYRVLSWKIDFPDYAPFESRRKKVILNKLNQACPGLDQTVAERVYGDAMVAVPVQHASFARFYVNGGYYHYMMDLEHIDADMMKRYRAPGEALGDLFKADGNGGPDNLEGPYYIGDERLAVPNPSCPNWTLDDRYAYTYQRVTNSWGTVADLRAMIESLNALRATAAMSGDYGPLRAWFKSTFDYQKLLDYIAVRNWAQPWDDQFHNHFLYRRADGKWIIIPQDVDREFGENFGWAAGKSFYIGEEGDPDNRSGLWSRLKDAFIKAYRPELWNRLVQLDAGPLGPASYKAQVAAAAAIFSLPDYQASPAAVNACRFEDELANMTRFGDCRHQDIVEGVAAAACKPGACGLQGEYYATLLGDATRDFAKATLRATRVDPQVNLSWGNNAPDPALPVDNFQVRWTGKATPRYTETYTFSTTTDDGVRLWVDGKLLIDRWVVQGATEYSATVALTAGVPVTIRMEYFDSTGGASARLSWSSPTQCKQPIASGSLAPM